jgi:hypothetical protein
MGAVEQVWVLRPEAGRSEALLALSGRPVHAVGAVGTDGQVDVVLRDGTRVRVRPREIVAERA